MGKDGDLIFPVSEVVENTCVIEGAHALKMPMASLPSLGLEIEYYVDLWGT
jgi:hypothetical protein